MMSLDYSGEYRKYRNLNYQYMHIIEQVKQNRADAKRIEGARALLDTSIWEAEANLVAAHEIDDLMRREMAIHQAEEDLRKAEEAIKKKNEQYEEIKLDLDKLKKEITAILNRLRSDIVASKRIDKALLQRFKKEMTIKARNREEAIEFRRKLGMVQDNLTGIGDITEEGRAMRLEYDSTMISITSLSDMIRYYEELETKLLSETIVQEPDSAEKANKSEEGQPAERKKTEQEMQADLLRAEELLEQELRPKRQDRAKSRAKLAEIISSEARKVDLDPRDMEDIRSVEEMHAKRESLREDISLLNSELALYDRVIHQLELKILFSSGKDIFSMLSGKLKKKKSAHEESKQHNSLKEPDDTEEERFVYRYKITQRELNRRYNQRLNLKDTITEHAYVEED